MRVIPVVKNLTEPEMEQFHSYLEAKLERITPILESHFPDDDAVTVDARIRKHEKHSAFDLEFGVNIPHGKFYSKEVKHSITEVLDLAVDKIESQMDKHFKKMKRA